MGGAAAGDWPPCGADEDEGVPPGRSTVRVGLPVTAWKLSITTLACERDISVSKVMSPWTH